MRIVNRSETVPEEFYSQDGKRRFVIKDEVIDGVFYRRSSFELNDKGNWFSYLTVRQEQKMGEGEVENDLFIRVRKGTEVVGVHLRENYSDVVERGLVVKDKKVKSLLPEIGQIEEVDVLETKYDFFDQFMGLESEKFGRLPELVMRKKTK